MENLEWQGNYVYLTVKAEDIETCSHSGSCDEDVAETLKLPHIKEEFARINPLDIVKELKEYGAWELDELLDEEQNRARLLWCACNDLSEENFLNATKVVYTSSESC